MNLYLKYPSFKIISNTYEGDFLQKWLTYFSHYFRKKKTASQIFDRVLNTP